MTTTQRLALTPIVDGFEVYDSTVGDIFTRKAGAWVQQAPLSGFKYANGVLVHTDIQGMYTAGVPILAAPGAGFMYVVHGLQLATTWVQNFAGGGAVYLQYGAAGHAGKQATANIAATLLTTVGASANSYATGSLTDGPTAQTDNTGIFITNATAVFTAGVATTVTWRAWYSIVPTV
jgi:hypothetical protein